MNKSLDFDPALRELLFRTTGKPAGELIPEHIAAREIPVVARLNATEAVIPNLRVVTRFGQIVTGRAPLGQVIELRNHPQIVSLKASLSFGPSLHRSVSHIHAHPEQLPRRTSGQLSGRGVIVGVIDWGCDFGHSNFRNSDGTTRLVAIWDQRPGPSPSSPAPYRYGRVMERDAIDAALMQGDPYRALGYHPSDVDFDGTGTHGTHILDIAAGNGRAPGSAAGVAPGADLLFVHLRGDDTLPQETLGDSVRLLEAVRWVLDRAGARPVVLNLSLGRTGGPHDGTTLVERALDAAVEEQAGRAIVMSTGNYFSAGMHSSGRLRSGQKTDLRFRLPRERRGVTELEIWYSGQDEFAAELVDPLGRAVTRVALGQQAVARSGRTTLATAYHRRNDPNNGDNHINLFVWPEARGGTWCVRLAAKTARSGRFHAWIERVARRDQARFAPGCTRQNSTTNTICNGRKTIAVGAYDARITGAPMTRFSSSGPTRDGRAKPDIAAPGAGIRAARSRPRRQQSGPDRVVQKSGTSMAAPHVTGTVALMFEAALPWRLTIEQTRAALLHTARPVTPVHRLDGIRSGAGRVDGVAAVTAVRQLLSRSTSNPSIEDHFIMSRNSEPFISGYRSEAEWALSWLQECGSRSEDIPTHLHGAILAEVLTTRDSLPTWYEASIQQGRPCGKDIATPEIHFDAAHKSNFTVAQRTARDIDAIVIHTVEGSARSAISAFKNPSSKVSSHFVISQTGAITQMVAVKNVAWTQTYYNPRAIGIECEGRACDPNTWTTALMTSLVQLTAWLSRTYQIPLVHPCGRARVTDLSVKNGQITGRVDRLNVSGLIGHEQIQPWNKNDPGPFFDWKLFLAALGQICR